MKVLYRLLPLAMIVILAGCQGATQSGVQLSDDWISLFDGQSLDGWSQLNGTATYEVEDGTIVGTTAEGSPNSFLCTDATFGDFEMEFEVDVDTALNSGVQIRSRTKEEATGTGPNDQPGRVFGPQIEIEASRANGAEAGYIYGEATGHGWLTPEDRLIPHKVFVDGSWNHYRIVAEGPRIQTFINQEPIEDLTHEEIYEAFPEGFICLQVHGIREGTGPYQVRWRNLRIRELSE